MSQSESAAALRAEMEHFSQHHFSAGWLSDLEFLLWDSITGGIRRQLAERLTDADITRLQDLSAKGGGWWCWPSEAEYTAHENDEEWFCGPVWSPMEEWLPRFEAWRKAHPPPCAECGRGPSKHEPGCSRQSD